MFPPPFLIPVPAALPPFSTTLPVPFLHTIPTPVSGPGAQIGHFYPSPSIGLTASSLLTTKLLNNFLPIPQNISFRTGKKTARHCPFLIPVRAVLPIPLKISLGKMARHCPKFNLQSTKPFLTLQLCQHHKSGSTFSSSEPAATAAPTVTRITASSDCRADSDH